MALQINDSTAIIRRLTNLIQGNSDWCIAVWIESSYLATAPDYITAISKQNAGYTAWSGIYTDPTLSTNSFEITANNGGGASNTANAVIGTNLAYLGYRKSGTSHLFYRNAVLIGSTTEDMSAVTFFEMLLGNDRFGGVNGIKFFDFIEYNQSKSVNTLIRQMRSIGTVVDSVGLVTFTPLLNDLNDISGNTNHWSGSGNFSFVSNPAFPTNVTVGNAINLAFGLTPTTISQNINVNGFVPDVFYKYTNNTSVDQVISVGHWGNLLGGYKADLEVTTDTALDIQAVNSFPDGSFTVPIPTGVTFYFRFHPNPQGSFSLSTLNIKTLLGPAGAAQAGDIFIRSATFSGAADISDVFIGLVGGFIRPGTGIIGYVPQFPTGESGDILPSSGRMIFADEGLSWEAPPPPNPTFSYWVYVVDPNFGIITKVAWESGNLPPVVNRTHLPTDKIYLIGYQSGGVETYSHIDANGVLGPIVTIPGGTYSFIKAIAVNNAETVMYVSDLGAIKTWDLVNQIPIGTIVAAVAGYEVTDLLVLADDTIIAVYWKGTATSDSFVRRYDSGGVLLNTYLSGTFTGLITGSVVARLGYSAQADAFWVFNHLSTAFSDLRKLTTAGATLVTQVTPDVNQSSIEQANPPIPYTSDSCPVIELRVSQVPTNGSIIVIKVTNPNTVTDEFQIQAGGGLSPTLFNLQNGESLTYLDVPVGIYSIIEVPKAGFSTTYNVSDGSPNDALNLGAGETITVIITNTIIQKVMSGIYKIVPGKRQDTLWLENFTGTRDVKIP